MSIYTGKTACSISGVLGRFSMVDPNLGPFLDTAGGRQVLNTTPAAGALHLVNNPWHCALLNGLVYSIGYTASSLSIGGYRKPNVTR